MRRCRYLAFVILGFALFLNAGLNIVDARLDPTYAGDSMLAAVRVIDFPKYKDKSVSFLLEPLADGRLPKRIRVNWFDPPQAPVEGDIWELELRLQRPRGRSNEGGFNIEDWMFRERLHASGYVVPSNRNRRLASTRSGFIAPLRDEFVARAIRHGGQSAAVIAAIGVGSRHLISQQQWQRYAITGTSHLMAISGLHIGLAATSTLALVILVSGWLRLRGSHIDRGVLFGLLAALAYALISGFAVPSQRAVLMLAIAAVAFRSHRLPDASRIIALVAIFVYCIDPISLLKPGFSLSFGAVVVLLWSAKAYCKPYWEDRWPAALSKKFRQLINMQVALLFGLIPLTVIIFDRVSVFAPVANLIVVPIFSFFAVPLTLASLVLAYVWENAAAALIRLAAIFVNWVESIIGFAASLPFADLGVASSGLNPLVIVLPAAWVILPRGWPARWLALVCTLAVLVHEPRSPRPGCVQLHVLDAGQGLAVVARSDQHTLVYDTGAAFRSGGSIAEQVIVPFLRYKGIEVIDWLVISHADNDHAGGLQTLLQAIPVSTLFLGEPIAGISRGSISCRAGHSWHDDGIGYRFLHPPADHPRDGNDASCVLSISAGAFKALLTGDIEAAAEHAILEAGVPISADVVSIPHHGSLTSSSPAFVNRVRPQIAIASAGYGNHWGFPKERVVKRWEGIGAVVMSTSRLGAISLEMCASTGVTDVQGQRGWRYRFWHEGPR